MRAAARTSRPAYAGAVTATIDLTTACPAPPAVMFALSLDVEEHLASMAHSGERAVGGVTSGRLALGQTVTWRARHFGLVWRMTSRITALDEPHRFVDEQVRGPFARFRHEHRFDATPSGCTMRDVISFDAPLGVLGRMVERAVLRRYLERLIRTRNESLVRAAAAGFGPPGPSGRD